MVQYKCDYNNTKIERGLTMSEADVQRLMKKVEEISEVVIRIDQRLVGYEDLQKCVSKHELTLDRIQTNCENIQKRKIKINVSFVFTEVIVGIILAAVGYFIGKGGI